MALGVSIPSVFGGQVNPKTGAVKGTSSNYNPNPVNVGGLSRGTSQPYKPSTGNAPIALPFNPVAGMGNMPIPLPFDPTRGQPLGGMMANWDETGGGFAGSDLLSQIWEMNARRAQEAMAAAGGDLGASAGFQNQRLDLKEKEIGVNRDTLNRQNPLLDELYGLREGQREGSKKYLDTIKGQTQKDFDQAMSYLDEELKFLDIGTASQQRKQRSEATAAGAVVTQGNRDAIGDINNENAQGKARIGNQRFGETSKRTRELASIEKQYGDIAFQSKIDKATTAEDKAKVYDQMKLLDLQAEELGISRAEVAQRLSSGMRAVKSSYNDLDQLLGALTSGDPNMIQQAQDYWNKFYKAGS